MTVENKPDNANAADGEANASKEPVVQKTLTQEEMLMQLAKLQATNERLLEESKKYKSKFTEVKEQKDAEEKRLLEEQGKYKELYQKQTSEMENLKKNLVFKEIKSAVSQEAVKLGVNDPEDLFKLGNSGLLQYDESTGSVVGVSEFLDDLKKRKAYLFNTKQGAAVSQVIPNGKTNLTGLKLNAEGLNKLNTAQRKQLLAQKFAQAAKG